MVRVARAGITYSYEPQNPRFGSQCLIVRAVGRLLWLCLVALVGSLLMSTVAVPYRV